VVDGTLAVVERLPEVPVEMRWRFPPDVAAHHTAWLADRLTA
jgi:hypothetical protein